MGSPLAPLLLGLVLCLMSPSGAVERGLARLRAKDVRSVTGFTAETVDYFLCSSGRVFEGETQQTLGL